MNKKGLKIIREFKKRRAQAVKIIIIHIIPLVLGIIILRELETTFGPEYYDLILIPFIFFFIFLIFSLGKKVGKILRCPQCNAVQGGMIRCTGNAAFSLDPKLCVKCGVPLKNIADINHYNYDSYSEETATDIKT